MAQRHQNLGRHTLEVVQVGCELAVGSQGPFPSTLAWYSFRRTDRLPAEGFLRRLGNSLSKYRHEAGIVVRAANDLASPQYVARRGLM